MARNRPSKRFGNQSGFVLVFVILLSLFGALTISYLSNTTLSFIKLKASHTVDEDLSLALNSIMNYTLQGVRQEWCFNSDWTHDETCSDGAKSLVHSRSTERLIMSTETVDALTALSKYDSSIVFPGPLSEISTSISLSGLSGSHPIKIATDQLTKYNYSKIDINIQRLESSLQPTRGREVILKVIITLSGGSLLSSNFTSTIEASVSVFPRELNTFGLILAKDLYLDQASPASGTLGIPQAALSLMDLQDYRGLKFQSPVYVNGNVYLSDGAYDNRSLPQPSAKANFSLVTFQSPLVLGPGPNGDKGLIMETSSTGTSTHFAPATPGGFNSQFFSQGVTFGGFLQGVQLDSQGDRGLDELAKSSTVDRSLMDACIRRKNAASDLSWTRQSALVLKKAAASGSGDNVTYNYKIGLTELNYFRKQLDPFMNADLAVDAKEATAKLISLKPSANFFPAQGGNPSLATSSKAPILKLEFTLKLINVNTANVINTGDANGGAITLNAVTEMAFDSTNTFQLSFNDLAELNTHYNLTANIKSLFAYLNGTYSLTPAAQAAINSAAAAYPAFYGFNYNYSYWSTKNSYWENAISAETAYRNNPVKFVFTTKSSTTGANNLDINELNLSVQIVNASLLANFGTLNRIEVNIEPYDVGYQNSNNNRRNNIYSLIDPIKPDKDINYSRIQTIALKGTTTAPLQIGDDPLLTDSWSVKTGSLDPSGWAPNGVQDIYDKPRSAVLPDDQGYFNDLLDLDNKCKEASDTSSSTLAGSSFKNVNWNTQFDVRDSWNFADPQDSAGEEYVIDQSIASPGKTVFKVKSTVSQCTIKSTAVYVVGFFVCNNLKIEARTMPLNIIGTFIVNNELKIDPSALKAGIVWKSIFNASATSDLRMLKILKPSYNQSCESISEPVWSPMPTIYSVADLSSCNAISLRKKAEPFTWTAVDPDCGHTDDNAAGNVCKKRIRRLILAEIQREIKLQ